MLILVPKTAEEALYALHNLPAGIRPPLLRVARSITSAEIDGERNQRWLNFYSQYLRARGLHLGENINYGIPYLRILKLVPITNILYLDTKK